MGFCPARVWPTSYGQKISRHTPSINRNSSIPYSLQSVENIWTHQLVLVVDVDTMNCWFIAPDIAQSAIPWRLSRIMLLYITRDFTSLLSRIQDNNSEAILFGRAKICDTWERSRDGTSETTCSSKSLVSLLKAFSLPSPQISGM